MSVHLSRPDGQGRRWTPCRTAHVVLQLRHGRYGGSQRDGYLVTNVTTGRNSQVRAFDAARDRAALYAQENAKSREATVDLTEPATT